MPEAGTNANLVADANHPMEPDLDGPIHQIFMPERWPELKEDPRRYNSFKPSFILASKLLQVAGPFLTSLIPNLRLDSLKDQILSTEKPSNDQLQQCYEELALIAQHMEWRENPHMWPDLHRHGLSVPQGGGIKPDQLIDDDLHARVWIKSTKRDMSKGLLCRRMTVYVASQYGDALMEYAGSGTLSMRYSQTVFMCAIIFVYEIAHVIYAASFANKPWRGEPLVQDEVLPELGTSLVAWLFNGWIPENISIDPDGKEGLAFRYGCCWYKQRRKPKAYPQYTTVHSMSMSHIQTLLSQRAWSKFDKHDTASYSRQVRTHLLGPSLPFMPGSTARVAKKANRFRVDVSPALISHYGTWDYHDPDWNSSREISRRKECLDRFVTPPFKFQ